MHRWLFVLFWVLGSGALHAQAPPPVAAVSFYAEPARILRRDAPEAFFGFNLNWQSFQRHFWRDGAVLPAVIDWLKAFPGAVYRFPGGTESNFYEWYKGVGPASTRGRVPDQFKHYAQVEFGFDEYLRMMQAVNGVPLVVANLNGSFEERWELARAAEINAAWVRHANGAQPLQDAPPACAPERRCVVHLWELGNEMDWKSTQWSAERYVAGVREVGAAMRKASPGIRLIANSATAPWGQPRAAEAFNRGLAPLRDFVDGFSIHPYYDGIAVPEMAGYIRRMQEQVGGAGVPVYVTEHARWPSKPLVGPWKQNWHQTGDIGGALATADFMLMLLPDESVRLTVWHALAVGGPWELFQFDAQRDRVYPNVVYWALRALRAGWLDHVVALRTQSPNRSAYAGGYDVRAAFMRDAAGQRHSLLAINRAGTAHVGVLQVPEWAGRAIRVTHRFVSGSGPTAGNTHDQPEAVTLQTTAFGARFDAAGKLTLTLPAYSVSSFVIDREQG